MTLDLEAQQTRSERQRGPEPDYGPRRYVLRRADDGSDIRRVKSNSNGAEN